jgi:2,5-furandicarboxylate decarboxylase 1
MSAIAERLPAPGTDAGWPATQDLRSWLGLLASRGQLGVVEREIDPRFQLAAALTRLDGRAAVLFERVAGASLPVVGNTVPGRAELAAAVGCEVGDLPAAFARALREPAPWREVDAAEAPVLACRMGDDPLDRLPIPVHHEKDGGRYLSAGVVVTRDPVAGAMNLSINRMQVTGPRELRALMLPGRLRRIADEVERRDEALDIAICIGVDPTVTQASQGRPARDVDELQVCSALRGSPIPVVRAPQLDLWIPARAEIVIEARMRPGERAMEGPFGEYPRTYGPSAPAPVLDVLDVWHREDPIFQTILAAGREHLLVGAIPREADLLARLRALHPNVHNVRMTEGGSCRFHAVVSMADPPAGQAVNVILAALASNPVFKQVVVVDRDVDVFDDEQVEWAIATRVQADRDLHVIRGAAGGASLDPSATEGITAKLGIDATTPPAAREKHARIGVPDIESFDADEWVTWP